MNLPRATPELTTERLLLRPLRTSDADTITRLCEEPALRHATRLLPPQTTETAASDWISQVTPHGNEPSSFTWAITDNERGILQGLVNLNIDPPRESAQLECWVAKPFRSQGVATEACQTVMQTAFSDFALHRLEGRHLMREQPAGRLVERLGLLPEGVRRQAEKWNGQFEDIAHYGLLRSDTGQ